MNVYNATTVCPCNNNVWLRNGGRKGRSYISWIYCRNSTQSYHISHAMVYSHLDSCKWDALKIALLAVISSCQAGGDRHWNVTLVLQVLLKSQLHSNASPSAVKLFSAKETTVIFASHAFLYNLTFPEKNINIILSEEYRPIFPRYLEDCVTLTHLYTASFETHISVIFFSAIHIISN